MIWREKDHPRHDNGRFRDKIGGWVSAVSERLTRRGAPAAEPPAEELPEVEATGPGFGGRDLIGEGRADELASAALAAAQPYRDEHGNELAGRRRYGGGGVGPHGDEALYHIAQVQGFDALPGLLTREEMDEAVRGGALELWRGGRGGSRTRAPQSGRDPPSPTRR